MSKKRPTAVARPALAGSAEPGHQFMPDAAEARQTVAPQPAPCPGTPVGPARLERMKRRARKVPIPQHLSAQDEDKLA